MKEIMSYKDRWGYKGTETALNGLTGWLQDHLELQGRLHDRYLTACRIIIDYAKANMPGFVKRGHAEHQADYVAKKVQQNNKFNYFVNWVKSNYDENGVKFIAPGDINYSHSSAASQ